MESEQGETVMNSNNNIQTLIKELGTLLSIRISQYVAKYKNGDESSLLNEFIVCPMNEFDRDDLRAPMIAKSHLEENLKINLDHFELHNLFLTSDRKIAYSFSVFPIFIDESYEDDYLDFSLVDDKITFYVRQHEDILAEFDAALVEKAIRKIQKEISFGTLSAS